MANSVELEVNGEKHAIQADPTTPLLDVLHEELNLTGTVFGCGEARCGACTVLIDGKPRRSCSTPLAAALGHSVRTIESAQNHPIDQALQSQDLFPCGHCVPGMVMAALALVESVPNPTEEQILQALSGHACRCGGGSGAGKAIQEALK